MASTPKGKGGKDAIQRRLAFEKKFTSAGVEDEPASETGYTPPAYFKQVKESVPLVEEAADSNTELWLVRMPTNEITQEDLAEKKLRITIDAPDGKVGQFYSLQGQEYSIVKHDVGNPIQPYAVIPSQAGPFIVRKVTRQVGFVRNLVSKDPIPHTSSLLDKGAVISPMQRTAVAVESGKSLETSSKKKRRHESSEKS